MPKSMSVIPVCLLFIFVFNNVTGNTAASQIQKCHKDDSKCLTQLVQSLVSTVIEGNTEFELKPLDPMFVDHIDASTSTLKLDLNDITVRGLKDCVVKHVRYNPDKSSLNMKLICAIDVDGQYVMNGKLLIIPIEGNGKMHVKLRKAVFAVDSELSVIKNLNEENHLNIVRWSHNYELKDKADLNFENLFNGNVLLGQAAKEVIRNASNEIVLEVGAPIVQIIISKVVDAVQILYDRIPLEELIID